MRALRHLVGVFFGSPAPFGGRFFWQPCTVWCFGCCVPPDVFGSSAALGFSRVLHCFVFWEPSLVSVFSGMLRDPGFLKRFTAAPRRSASAFGGVFCGSPAPRGGVCFGRPAPFVRFFLAALHCWVFWELSSPGCFWQLCSLRLFWSALPFCFIGSPFWFCCFLECYETRHFLSALPRRAEGVLLCFVCFWQPCTMWWGFSW